MNRDLDLERVRRNVANATTEDLLDRATVYRHGMEPEALKIIEAELRRREVSGDMIRDHWENRRSNALVAGSVAVRCSFCDRPAIARGWGWHWLWRKIPILPWRHRYCEEHLPPARR